MNKETGEKKRIIIISVLCVCVAVIAIIIGMVVHGKNNIAEKSEAEATEKIVEVDATEKDSETAAKETTTQETSTQETTVSETTAQETSTQQPQTENSNEEPTTITGSGIDHSSDGFQFEETGDTKYAYLTFDDGPSENTHAILDILNQYGVKATFFTIYKNDPESIERYQAIVNEGNTIGMHSCSHNYKALYASEDSFQTDTRQIHDWIYQVTGVDTRLYRFPGGSSNTVSPVDMNVYINDLTNMGLMYYDWNVSSGDASSKPISAEEMVANISSQIEGYTRVMILMHDTRVKTETVRALPQIIETLQNAGYQIVPITEKTKPVQHVKASYMQ